MMRGIITYNCKQNEKGEFDIVLRDCSDAPENPWYDVNIFFLISDEQIARLEETFGTYAINEGGTVIRPVYLSIDARWVEIEEVCNALGTVLGAIQWE